MPFTVKLLGCENGFKKIKLIHGKTAAIQKDPRSNKNCIDDVDWINERLLKNFDKLLVNLKHLYSSLYGNVEFHKNENRNCYFNN